MYRVTIKDIAKRLNVSVATISNALNDKPGVGTDVKKKIIKLAKEMGYQPNFSAKSLVSRNSFAIGLIVSSIADSFYPELALGVQDKATEHGYTMLLFNTNHSMENEIKCIEMLKSRGVDGIVLSTVLQNDPCIELLDETDIPYVLVNRVIINPKKAGKIDSVSIDNYDGSYKAAEHLCKLGHQKIAMIKGNMKSSTAIFRTEGALDAFTEYGINIEPELNIECDYSMKKAYKAASQIFSRRNKKERPSAFLAQGDNMALGIRDAAIEAGLRIPEDLAIIGFDNISICALKGIELTTVSQNQYQMGAKSAELLIAKIKDRTHRTLTNQIVMAAELIVRNSCGFNLNGYVK